MPVRRKVQSSSRVYLIGLMDGTRMLTPPMPVDENEKEGFLEAINEVFKPKQIINCYNLKSDKSFIDAVSVDLRTFAKPKVQHAEESKKTGTRIIKSRRRRGDANRKKVQRPNQ